MYENFTNSCFVFILGHFTPVTWVKLSRNGRLSVGAKYSSWQNKMGDEICVLNLNCRYLFLEIQRNKGIKHFD